MVSVDMIFLVNLARNRYGCPKKMAEQKFYETIAAIKKVFIFSIFLAALAALYLPLSVPF